MRQSHFLSSFSPSSHIKNTHQENSDYRVNQSDHQADTPFQNTTCHMGHDCKLLCASVECNEDILVCQRLESPCRQTHKYCLLLEPQNLFRRVSAKIIQNKRLQNFLGKIIQDVIDWICDFEESFKFLGLTPLEAGFLKKIERKNFEQLSKQEIRTISQDFFNQSHEKTTLSTDQVQGIEQQISLYWNQTFKGIQKDFLHMESLLKNVVQNAMQNQSQVPQKVNDLSLISGEIDSKIVLQVQELHRLQDIIGVSASGQSKSLQKLEEYKQVNANKFKLLYRASEHNFEVEAFFQKSAEYPNTLILIETEMGKKIGGFTPQPWKRNFNYETYFIADPSNQSFIFSLSNNDRFQLKNPQKALSSWYLNNYGPIFGEDDLTVCSNANKTKKSVCLQSGDYANTKYEPKCKFAYEMFSGSSEGEFLIKEWEVFQVTKAYRCQQEIEDDLTQGKYASE